MHMKHPSWGLIYIPWEGFWLVQHRMENGLYMTWSPTKRSQNFMTMQVYTPHQTDKLTGQCSGVQIYIPMDMSISSGVKTVQFMSTISSQELSTALSVPPPALSVLFTSVPTATGSLKPTPSTRQSVSGTCVKLLLWHSSYRGVRWVEESGGIMGDSIWRWGGIRVWKFGRIRRRERILRRLQRSRWRVGGCNVLSGGWMGRRLFVGDWRMGRFVFLVL